MHMYFDENKVEVLEQFGCSLVTEQTNPQMSSQVRKLDVKHMLKYIGASHLLSTNLQWISFLYQATQFVQKQARICNTPGGTNDKAYAIYVSQLKSTGMLKGGNITDRFFRILVECEPLYTFLINFGTTVQLLFSWLMLDKLVHKRYPVSMGYGVFSLLICDHVNGFVWNSRLELPRTNLHLQFFVLLC